MSKKRSLSVSSIFFLAMFVSLLLSSTKVFTEPIQWKIEDGGNGHW